jgi:transcriptional regulator with XRE-family HTH domain
MDEKKTLREVREAQGRSLREVARTAGIAPGELSLIERGLRNPSVSKLRRICAALGLRNAEELLGHLVPKRPGSG